MRAGPLSVANVYIGWDPREDAAYQVAYESILRSASIPVRITPLRLGQLEQQGIVRRPRSRLEKGRQAILSDGRIERRVVTAAQRGTLWDHVSNAPMATEFACSRFAVPIIAQSGWAIFVDCDVVVRGDIGELLAEADPQYAVQVVKHGALEETGTKMDGQQQLPYHRKNWSSVMLFNCDHLSNRFLTLEKLNKTPGRDLHRFCWLRDDEVGALPTAWNWLVGVQPCPTDWKLAHFTLGGPWLPGWSVGEHDHIWLSAAKNHRPTGGTGDGGADARAPQPR